MIQCEYPNASIFLEKRLPGTTRSPDVWAKDGDHIVCAIEIGYTDAVKLRLYRSLGIPDIRWYDKELNLALRETLPRPRKPIAFPPKARRWNRTEAGVAEYIESRIMPPDHIFPNEDLDEMFPGPFAWYVVPSDCTFCEHDPKSCDYEGKLPKKDHGTFYNPECWGCVSTDAVFFDEERTSVYCDCHCKAEHSCWQGEGLSHEDWGESYTSHCRKLYSMIRDREVLMSGNVTLLVPEGFNFFQAARYSYAVRNGPPPNKPVPPTDIPVVAQVA